MHLLWIRDDEIVRRWDLPWSAESVSLAFDDRQRLHMAVGRTYAIHYRRYDDTRKQSR